MTQTPQNQSQKSAVAPLAHQQEGAATNTATNPPPAVALPSGSQTRYLNIEHESRRIHRQRQKGRGGYKARREERSLAVLGQHYPEVFGRNASIRPLAIGIHKQIAQDCEAGIVPLSPIQVRYALTYWTRRPAYLKRLVEGASRVNLRGYAEGTVTREDADHARVLFAEQAAARMAAKGSTQPPPSPQPPKP